MKKLSKGEFNRNPRTAYLAFLFQTFLKRSFGYIIGILYMVYLSVILLIVPVVIHQDPLFIWNTAAFNMPIFNLFFIAAATSSIAVAIFRVGREDGTDLALSAKPITKRSTVALKTITYILIMLIFCVLAMIIISLILPIFGEYNALTNPYGVVVSKYVGILLSTFVGNLVNMCFFGGIAVFISMVGGQVITMIGTIGVAFVFCMMNFIYPQVVTTPQDVINARYNTDILSFRANTLEQYYDPASGTDQYSYATIQCYTDDDLKPTIDVDTYEGWNRATMSSGTSLINYIDFGKQLSNLYQAFGLETMKLDDAKELFIGANAGFNYSINPDTHVKDHGEDKKYPISVYDQNSSQGKIYPTVRIIGGNVSKLRLDNWYIYSRLALVDPASICVVSSSPSSFEIILNDDHRALFKYRPYLLLSEAALTQPQKELAEKWWDGRGESQEYESYLNTQFLLPDNRINFLYHKMETEGKGIFYDADVDWDNDWKQAFDLITKVHLYWAILAHETQRTMIKDYFDKVGRPVSFPYSSEEVNIWWEAINDPMYKNPLEKVINYNLITALDEGFKIAADIPYYSKLPTCEFAYAETFSNLYQYNVTNFYSVYTVIAAWSVISLILLTASIIVYRKTDFK